LQLAARIPKQLGKSVILLCISIPFRLLLPLEKLPSLAFGEYSNSPPLQIKIDYVSLR
jgi:hypothetical protein